MKNRIIIILLAVLLVCCLAITVTACKQDQDCSVTGEHTWDEGEVTIKAECEKAGEKTFTCTVCGETKKEAIAATGHTEVAVGANVDPDCINAGSTQGKKCSVCNKTLVEAGVVEALGHDFDEEIEANVTITATCVAAGKKIVKCSRCDETEETDVAKGAHKYGEWTVIAEATCAATGSKERVCSVCNEDAEGHKQTETIEKLPHTVGDWVTTDANEHWKECSVCHQQADKAEHEFTYKITADTHKQACVCGKAGEEEAHAYTDALCVCGSINTAFSITSFEALLASVPNAGDTSEAKFFVVGIVESTTDVYNSQMTIKNGKGETLNVYVVLSADGSRDQAPSKTYKKGDVVVVWGVANNYNGTAQLKNGMVVQHKGTVAKNTPAVLLTDVNLVDKTSADFALPQMEGLTWAVTEGDAIAIDGTTAKVTPGSTLKTVKLTATLVVNDETATKEYVITVAPAGVGMLVLDFTQITGITGNDVEKTFTVNGVEFKLYNCKENGGYLMMYGKTNSSSLDKSDNKGNAYLASSVALPGGIISIEVEIRTGSSDQAIYNVSVGANSILENKTSDKNKTGAGVQAFAFNSAENNRFFNISLTSDNDSRNGQLLKVTITYRDCEHENLTLKNSKAADCTDGYAQHYECNVCGDWFSDAEGKTSMAKDIIPAVHKFEKAANHYTANAATCENDGNIEYYVCDDCGVFFNADKSAVIEEADTVIAKLGHKWGAWAQGTGDDIEKHVRICANDAAHVEKVAHSQSANSWKAYDGDKHYKVCDTCGANFDGEDHAWDNGVCTADGCKATSKPFAKVTITVNENVKVYNGSDTEALQAENNKIDYYVEADDNGNIVWEFKVEANDGYTITSVKFNGEALTVGANGKYTTPAITANSNPQIVIEATKILSEQLVLSLSPTDFNSTSYAANNGTHTKDGYTYTSNQVMLQGSNMQWQKSNGAITITGKFSKIVITSSAGTFTVTNATNSNGTWTCNNSDAETTYQIKVGSATGTIQKIEFYAMV